MQTYIVYISALLFVIFFAYLAEKGHTKSEKGICLSVIIFILTFVAGCRGVTVGVDTKSYIQIFEYLQKDMIGWAYGEVGFKYFSYIFLKITNSHTALFLCFAFVTNLFIILRFWDFKKISSFSWMVACYYVSFYFMTMNIMRHFLAIAIIFYATRYIERKKYFKFICFVAVASLFHTSALIGLAFVAFDVFQWRYLSRKQRNFMWVASLSLPLVLVGAILVVIRYKHYFDTMGSVNIGLMLFVKLAVFFFSLLLFYKKDNSFDGEISEVYRVRCIKVYYLIGILLTGLGYLFSYMDRIGLPFYIFECIYYGILVKSTRGKFLFKLMIFVVLAYYFVMSMRGGGQGTIPYVFAWQ